MWDTLALSRQKDVPFVPRGVTERDGSMTVPGFSCLVLCCHLPSELKCWVSSAPEEADRIYIPAGSLLVAK